MPRKSDNARSTKSRLPKVYEALPAAQRKQWLDFGEFLASRTEDDVASWARAAGRSAKPVLPLNKWNDVYPAQRASRRKGA